MKKLIELKIPTKRDGKWRESVIYKMLRNEKYAGNLLLQKSFSSDNINKKKFDNRGEIPMYYVGNSHKAIVDKAILNSVQEELEKGSKLCKAPKINSRIYQFMGKITC